MTKERVGSLIFLCAGIYGLIFSVHIPLGKWNNPGPGVLPMSLSILLCASGILWFIWGKKKKEEGARIDWHGLGRQLVPPMQVVMLTAAFVAVLSRIGYVAASTLYLFILFLWVSHYKFLFAMGLAVFIGVGSWYFFGKILAIQLPTTGFWIL